MVFETNIICFGHMKHMKKKPNSQEECGVGERGGIIVCGLLPPPTDSFHRPRTPSTVCGLLPPPRAVPPPSKREVLGFRRSRPAALPSIGYRGFAVAPMTLRAPSRWIVVITSGINGRVMRAPTGDSGATVATVAMKQPSVANASHRFDFRHVVGARIARPPTLFKPSIFHPKDLPHRGRGTAPWVVEGVNAGGGRSSFPSLLCRPSFCFPTHVIRGTRSI